MIEDAEMTVLITQHRLARDLPQSQAHIVCLDADWPVIARHSDGDPINTTTPENLAYVIYTSGSTGKPKGVQVLHHAVVNTLNSLRRQPGLVAEDRMLAITTLSFDIAVVELLLPLAVGASVVLVSRAVALDGHQLSQRLEVDEVSVMQATPATWRLLLEAGWPGRHHLKLFCGGEALTSELAHELLDRGASLWNLYGPTEVTIYSIGYQVQPGDHSIPIGRPIANLQTYILDQSLHPLPVGVPGHLHIGGDGLARGYLNRPDLTAEAFIPDPFIGRRKAEGGRRNEESECSTLKSGIDKSAIRNPQSAIGSRLYRTGDLARYRSDGCIEFLGRLDHQVKVRGFRIEPGEIEAMLNQHPGVQRSVVLARNGDLSFSQRRLVAYIVPDQRHPFTISDLRQSLQSKVPDYMVPSTYVMMDALPLTPSGKVDRRRLPQPDEARPELVDTYEPARTPVEEVLAGIWADVLRLERVGVNDNFFELGGYSLPAVRLMSRVRETFHVELPLHSLFEKPTVARLAEAIQMARQIGPSALSWSPLVAIQPHGSNPPIFAVHPIGGSVYYYVNLARHLGLDQPFYGLQAPSLDREEATHHQLEDMAAHYIEAVQSIQPRGPYLLTGWSFGGVVAFEMAQQLRRQGQEVGLLAVLDTAAPRLHGTLLDRDEMMVVIWLAREMGRQRGIDLPITIDEVRALGPEEQLDSILDHLKRADLLPADIDRAAVRRFLRGYRARIRAIQNYVPQIYAGTITLFRTREMDPEIVKHAPAEAVAAARQPSYGWQALSSQPVELRIVPGFHETMVLEPHVRDLAKELRRCIARAIKRNGARPGWLSRVKAKTSALMVNIGRRYRFSILDRNVHETH
jgi:amino acid adenylation domain-containing protein